MSKSNRQVKLPNENVYFDRNLQKILPDIDMLVCCSLWSKLRCSCKDWDYKDLLLQLYLLLKWKKNVKKKKKETKNKKQKSSFVKKCNEIKGYKIGKRDETT